MRDATHEVGIERLDRDKANKLLVLQAVPEKDDGIDGDFAWDGTYFYWKTGGDWYRTTNVGVKVT